MNSGRPRCVTCTYRCPRKRERIRERKKDRNRDWEHQHDPVQTSLLCATNNITYPTWCHIVKDACITGFVLETKHAGPCDIHDTSLYTGNFTFIIIFLWYSIIYLLQMKAYFKTNFFFFH